MAASNGHCITDIVEKIKKEHSDPTLDKLHDLPIRVSYRFVLRIIITSTNNYAAHLLIGSWTDIHANIVKCDKGFES